MRTLAAVDPGKAGLGWAIFVDDLLFKAGILENASHQLATIYLRELFRGWKPFRAAIEVPQVYQQKLWKGDPNDLIDVAVIAGIAVAALAPWCAPELVRPHAWKGNAPKAVGNKQTLARMDECEKIVLRASGATKSKEHNVLDAIGLGLWKLGRR